MMSPEMFYELQQRQQQPQQPPPQQQQLQLQQLQTPDILGTAAERAAGVVGLGYESSAIAGGDQISEAFLWNASSQDNDDTTVAITVTKLMQRRSNSFRNAWASYCTTNGGGRNDPAKHDPSFHIQFFDFLAQQVGGDLTPSAVTMIGMGLEPPMKKMKPLPGTGGGGSGDPAKDLLVEQIKVFQQLGDRQREAWWEHCDLNLGGIRDPSRHDASILQNFVMAYGVYKAVAGRTSQDLDPVKASLVSRVKAFQRNPEQKEAWYGFCGEIKDPGRHTLGELQEFIARYGVP